MFRTLELFAIFKHVFGFLSYILAFAIIMIIILNSNSAIKQNVYEIGLMKALGAKTKDLVVIFALQMIVISLCVCVCLYSFSQFVTYVADIILQKGIMAYIGRSNLTIDFKTVIFNDLFFIINVAVITLGTVLSVIVPIVAIRKIKPLKIIKTRN
jgi:ABC-type antimicrobial peptide transport system permease subunit